MKRWLTSLRTDAFIIAFVTSASLSFASVLAQVADGDTENESRATTDQQERDVPPNTPDSMDDLLARGPEPLPTRRHGHRMHLQGGKLVVFGGYSRSSQDGGGKKATWIYDFETDQWRRGADLRRGRAFFSSVKVDGDVYAIGGSIEVYDFEEDRWETIYSGRELPVSHFGAAAVGRTIFTVGGFPSDRARVTSFDIETRMVKEVPRLPGRSRGDHLHFVAELGGELHVLGGLYGKTMHWVFDGREWREAAAIPEPAWAKFAVYEVVDDRLFMFWEDGGYCYDLESDTWSKVQPLNEQLAMAASFVSDGRIYVLGGLATRSAARVVRVYDIRRDKWEILD